MNKDTDKNKMIIELGGKQHLVGVGSRIVINQDSSKEGDAVVTKDLLSGADVNLKILKNFLGDKINGMKFKSKIRYTRRYGHRQKLAILEVLGDNSVSKSTVAKKPKDKKVKSGAPKKSVQSKAKAGVK